MIPYLIFKFKKLKSQQKKYNYYFNYMYVCIYVYLYVGMCATALCGDHRSRKFAVRLYLLGMSEAIPKASPTWLSEPELSKDDPNRHTSVSGVRCNPQGIEPRHRITDNKRMLRVGGIILPREKYNWLYSTKWLVLKTYLQITLTLYRLRRLYL